MARRVVCAKPGGLENIPVRRAVAALPALGRAPGSVSHPEPEPWVSPVSGRMSASLGGGAVEGDGWLTLVLSQSPDALNEAATDSLSHS